MSTDDSRLIEVSQDMTKAKFYVLATDSFMSGWGLAENKSNVLVIPCDDLRTAEEVEQVLKARDEMKRVRVTANRPRLRPEWHLQELRPDTVRGWDHDEKIVCAWLKDGAAWEAHIPGGDLMHRTRFKVEPAGFVTSVYEGGWAHGIEEPHGPLSWTAGDTQANITKRRRDGQEVRIFWPDGNIRETLEPIQ